MCWWEGRAHDEASWLPSLLVWLLARCICRPDSTTSSVTSRKNWKRWLNISHDMASLCSRLYPFSSNLYSLTTLAKGHRVIGKPRASILSLLYFSLLMQVHTLRQPASSEKISTSCNKSLLGLKGYLSLYPGSNPFSSASRDLP